MKRRDLLVELGCEELPARALVDQARMLRDGLAGQLADAGLVEGPDRARWLATPRRLAVIVDEVAERQPDRLLERKGPAESAAFDADGKPTRAALGFAKSVGLEVGQLDRLENDQGRWLYAEIEQPGRALADLLQDILEKVVRQMAGARSMRWSDRSDRFLRPVRWLVALHGDGIVDLSLFGLRSGRTTRGHRIHAPGEHEIHAPADYEAVLENAYVLADFGRRRERIEAQLRECAAGAGLELNDDPALLDEVTGLVEWPIAVVGAFDESFLEVPPEALVSSMREHQKSFPLYAAGEKLANRFIAVANLESLDPPLMVHGFERVIRPRLADAKFFYEVDRRKPLHERFERLSEMMFQERLGSLADKSRRLMELAADLAPAFGADPDACRRAAELCKCDLLTEMVGEFPELQGTMGRYYALADGEPGPVATAIETHYLPRQAGDELPPDPVGRAVAVADRLDTLVGVFAAGKKPKGGKDPFGLRRAALAVVRILEDTGCTLGLDDLLERAAGVLGRQLTVDAGTRTELRSFLDERLRSHLAERGIETNTLHAVTAGARGSVVDFVRRAEAVQRFADDPEVASLIAANKRAANLLEQADADDLGDVDENSLQIDAETALFNEVREIEERVQALLAESDYPAVLKNLAGLKPAVDRFFDDVMVMVDDAKLRTNRLALLARLRRLFLRIADVARLGRS
ncbi:MAG: glycine--tRNA ligase subunit beta [Wenzhouxiangellaceae bacterium]|nr:glycine--tRNA ligase subunit beta [Wenzhouxiangellaceae bacterium]